MTDEQIRAARMRYEVTGKLPECFKFPKSPLQYDRFPCTVCLTPTHWARRNGPTQTVIGWCTQCSTRRILCDR